MPPLHHTARACAPAQRPPPSSTLDLPRLLPATHASCLSACTRLLNLRVFVKSNTQGPILVPLPSPPTHHSGPSAPPHQYARPSAPTSPAAHETRSPRAIGARRSATTHGLSTPDIPHPSPSRNMSRRRDGSASSVSDDSQSSDLADDAAGNQGGDAAPEEYAGYVSLHTHRSVCTPSPTTCYRAPYVRSLPSLLLLLSTAPLAPLLLRSTRSFAPHSPHSPHHSIGGLRPPRSLRSHPPLSPKKGPMGGVAGVP